MRRAVFPIQGRFFIGLLNSMACAALRSSMASTFSTLLITRRHLVAALAPMLTWSSWLLDEEMLSTDRGCAKLFIFANNTRGRVLRYHKAGI